MTNTKVLFTEEAIHLAQHVQIIKALKVAEAELPTEITINRSPIEPPVYSPIEEAIASAQQELLDELQTFIESIPDDTLQEALIDLLEADEENDQCITNMDLLDESSEEEANEIIKRLNLSRDALEQAWDNLLTEVDGYVEDVLKGVTR
ncbi:hypothetical protein [Bacillus toyonensis]|uniref:hypothetical protein n=1 Tax=Bacillus toyonensis TaxID=155322 RepID=UPI001C01D159|nr:hypothetical protein [Bacillus toyonensis]UFH99690.1 hypothetical protein HQN46_0010220 [Bacillus toyonensis]